MLSSFCLKQNVLNIGELAQRMLWPTRKIKRSDLSLSTCVGTSKNESIEAVNKNYTAHIHVENIHIQIFNFPIKRNEH